MLTKKICPRCVQFINYFSISILQTRFKSTNLPTSINDDTDTNINIDQNISRLPDDVYQQFKGKLIHNYI